MEKKLRLNWEIYNGDVDSVDRYCHNCGKRVEFIDSLKRRQNANGKNIYHFAIYKCPKGHTWNKEIAGFKALSGLENLDGEFIYSHSKYQELPIESFKMKDIFYVEIFLNILQERVRFDKFLSSKIIGLSRQEIAGLIEDGKITLNGMVAKSKQRLKEKDLITMKIGEI